jgi:hypothetical protein
MLMVDQSIWWRYQFNITTEFGVFGVALESHAALKKSSACFEPAQFHRQF